MSLSVWRTVIEAWTSPKGHHMIRLDCGHVRRGITLDVPGRGIICRQCSDAKEKKGNE